MDITFPKVSFIKLPPCNKIIPQVLHEINTCGIIYVE
nr:MAG TPA: hypothetical protein [Caudoviricetes sp.]